MKKSIVVFLLIFVQVQAQQGGMWIPSLLQGMNEKEMKSLGMKMSVADIYDVNKSSLKDAVPHFNGGCTSEVISPKGLLLTNHHCGFDAIQTHSSLEHDYLTEIQPQGEAFMASLAERLLASEKGGAAFFLDYGFPESEFFHPERHMGTVMCHQAHKADANPLAAVGLKDITAHVNFTGIALAGQDAGLNVLGYTSQARFLLNLGLAERMAASALAERAQAMKLISEHEMGELFKVVGFATHDHWQAQGFAAGDRSHRL